MKYVPVPVSRIALGKPVPVSLWDPSGHLLLRKGQPIESERQREVLAGHTASATAADFRAWQRAYDRQIYTMLRDGKTLEEIANTPMPDAIRDADYAVGHDVVGGWLDVQAALSGLLQQGEAARNALERLEGIEKRATQLMLSNVDESLFHLFQALADTSLSYCATHALLASLLCALTSRKLEVQPVVIPSLCRAALLMNVGMAREQDHLAKQTAKLSAAQRELIADHPRLGAELLARHFEVADEDVLDLVRWHHELDESRGLARNLPCRRILRTADVFVAKMAARKTRHALSALGATKSIFVGASGEQARVGSAMASVLGFYPPGSYVTLANGELAVSARRGLTANTPLVVSITNGEGVALAKLEARDTRDKQFTILAPVDAAKVKVKLNAERVLSAAHRAPLVP
jgi:HD-GYP domain-containing protein (c-di-GMP phosphodiesterase class II)